MEGPHFLEVGSLGRLLAALHRVIAPWRPTVATPGGRAPATPARPAVGTVLGRSVLVDRATGECALPGLGKTEAEEVLDWLEASGCQRRELCYHDGEGFTVRWYRPG